MTTKVNIIYCGGWGYRPKATAIKQAIEKEFPGKVEVTIEPTPTVSGYLEVQVVDGPLLHSKKDGQGYVDTPEKMNAILSKLRAHMGGAAAA